MDLTARSQRLFFALWPVPALQRQLAALPDQMLGSRAGRRIPAGNVHLTLAFLGAVDATTRTCLEQGASTIHTQAFDLTLDTLGCFRRHGLLWTGTSRWPIPLLELVAAIHAAQAACGLSPDPRAFQTHVTLARNLRRCPPERTIEPIVWPVQEFALVGSELGGGGARYHVLRTWTLV